MRAKLAALAACVLMMGAAMVWADDAATKEVTLKGTLECAKCQLHETKTCQNVLVVKDGDKEVKYYLTGDVSKKAHHDDGVCTAAKENVSVTGEVTEQDGKKMLAATKVDAGA